MVQPNGIVLFGFGVRRRMSLEGDIYVLVRIPKGQSLGAPFRSFVDRPSRRVQSPRVQLHRPRSQPEGKRSTSAADEGRGGATGVRREGLVHRAGLSELLERNPDEPVE